MMASSRLRTSAWRISLHRHQGLHSALTGKLTHTETQPFGDGCLSLPCLLRFVLLASGLGLGSSHADSMLGLQLLVDMVTGQLGDMGEQSGAATISRVLLAGNLLSRSTQDKDVSTKVAR